MIAVAFLVAIVAGVLAAIRHVPRPIPWVLPALALAAGLLVAGHEHASAIAHRTGDGDNSRITTVATALITVMAYVLVTVGTLARRRRP